VKGQAYKNKLLYLVDEDTRSFNRIIDAIRMPKNTAEEKSIRQNAIEEATQYATEIPFQVMETACDSLEVMEAMVREGIPNSLSDAAVGVLCAKTAVTGAYLNVRINAKDLKDEKFVEDILDRAAKIHRRATDIENSVLKIVDSRI
jgi:glutamate formiminotransferase/formiminotetrahydrofolate cyclodeaminase